MKNGNVMKWVVWIVLIAIEPLQFATGAERVTTVPTVHAAEADDREWSVVLVELAPGAVDARHFHPGIEIVYVLEGAGFLEVDGDSPLALNPGMVAALPQDRAHVLKNTSPTGTLKVLVVFFREKQEKRLALRPEGSNSAVLNATESASIHS